VTVAVPLQTFQLTNDNAENFLLHETEDKLLTDGERLLWKLIDKLQRHLVSVDRLRRCAGIHTK